MDINIVLDLSFWSLFAIAAGSFLGKDGRSFTWTVVKTIARWSIGK